MSEQVNTALKWAAGLIGSRSESPRLDAELLLAHCLGKPRSYLYGRPEEPLEKDCWARFQALVHARLKPTPIAYLVGTREFYSLEFAATPAALVPRPETELLVERALALLPAGDAPRVVDLGTGSGVIAITLKRYRPDARVTATDVDPACLELARANAARHEAEIEWIESNWYDALPGSRRFDLIVANPPYVAAGHPFLAEGDLPAEPGLALTPGPTGLEALEVIVAGAPRHLDAGGRIAVEHGYDQQAAVAGLLVAAGFDAVECSEDHNRLPRVTTAKIVENAQPSA